MNTITRSILAIVLTGLTACGGSGGGGDSSTPIVAPTPTTPPADQAIGGLWVGTDSNGQTINALSTEGGRVHWIAPNTGEQGFGTGSASGTAVTINYTYVAPIGFVLTDGSTSASCSAVGTIQERQSITANVSCTTSLGDTFSNSVVLSYDSLYDRDSSLSAIAGNFDDVGSVINVNANGVTFEQDPGTGCIINGQISIIDPQFNAYDIAYTYSNCGGSLALLNGATFTGLGILDNTVAPEQAIIGVTGQAGGITYSQVLVLPRT